MNLFDTILLIIVAISSGTAVDLAIRKDAKWAGHTVTMFVLALGTLLHRLSMGI